jgi:hypothetical protein
MTTPVDQFIGDLDGGQLEEKFSKVISLVAGAVMDHGTAGEITIKFKIKKLSEQQVMVEHDLYFMRPTQRGKQSENETNKTPMFVGEKAKVTFLPEHQNTMFDKKGEVHLKQ